MKKTTVKVISSLLGVSMLGGLFACGGGGSKSDIRFTYSGSTDILSAFGKMVDEFNKTVGKKEGISVKKNPVPESGLSGVLTQRLPSKSGPDVVAILDEAFKINTKNLMDLTADIDDEFIDQFYENSASRYRYNRETTTSNATDPLYGLPFYNDTTVLYYNKTALEDQNVICISVEEEDLAAFNSGAADENGKTKSDYGITIDVPARGFYRNLNPFDPAEDEHDADSWIAPSEDEVLIFNDRIAMSWDEIEDVGLLCTKSRNNDSITQYGYYTEWWFNYGWSVGGNCLQDVTGGGDWTYSLPSDLPNYIVNEGKTYQGKYTKKTYSAGETLDMQDIIAEEGDVLDVYFDDHSFYYTVNGQRESVLADVLSAEKSGTLTELPSIQDAFSRFCYLAGVGGSNVCPYPSQFNSVSSYQFFASNTLGFLVERISNYDYIEKNAKFEFGIARMPVYKEYENVDDAESEVAVKGKDTYHSFGHCLSIRKTTEKKEKALTFLKWAVTEGQKFFAEQGYFSTRKADRDIMLAHSQYGNSEIIADSMAEAKAGDWWYMPDRSWIDNWATPLNGSVRYGSLTLQEFLYKYIEVTNTALANYKR